MSALRSSLTRRAPTVYRGIGARRSFQTGRVLGAGKESTLHNEGRAEQAEHHKQDQLNKQKEGKGHWKDELASDSESIVKADRNDMQNADETINELQQESVKAAQEDADKNA